MLPLFLRHIVSLGLVSLRTALPPATAVFARKASKSTSVSGDPPGNTELLRGPLRTDTPPNVQQRRQTPLMTAALHGRGVEVAPCWTRGRSAQASEAEITALLSGASMQTRSAVAERGADPNARSALRRHAINDNGRLAHRFGGDRAIPGGESRHHPPQQGRPHRGAIRGPQRERANRAAAARENQEHQPIAGNLRAAGRRWPLPPRGFPTLSTLLAHGADPNRRTRLAATD